MTFIRKEAVSIIKFYWEAVIGILLFIIGLGLIFSIFWINIIFGLLLIFFGSVLLISFSQRYILLGKQENLGHISVTERQIIYDHTANGGFISLDLLKTIFLVIEKSESYKIERFWRLEDCEGNFLMFPTNAFGVDKFIESLIFLKKVNYGSFRLAMASKKIENIIVWQSFK